MCSHAYSHRQATQILAAALISKPPRPQHSQDSLDVGSSPHIQAGILTRAPTSRGAVCNLYHPSLCHPTWSSPCRLQRPTHLEKASQSQSPAPLEHVHAPSQHSRACSNTLSSLQSRHSSHRTTAHRYQGTPSSACSNLA